MELLILLLPAAAASGWLAARRSMRQQQERQCEADMDSAYYRGLNYLVNEQPDKAIDVFVSMLEVNSETVEMHLALGSLFRRRGEVDRAIRIHQNLIARPTLSAEQRSQAVLALGNDYMKAGLLDRAEGLFEELVESKRKLQPALNNLKIIYQHEKDWQKSLEVSQRLDLLGEKGEGDDQAHFLCELAENAISDGDDLQAESYLQLALEVSPLSLRPQLIMAGMSEKRGDCLEAINRFKQIASRHPNFIGEILRPMAECYRRLQQQSEWIAWLREIYASKRNLHVMLEIAAELENSDGADAAIAFLTAELANSPNLKGIHRLISLRMAEQGEQQSQFLSTINQFVERMAAKQSAYLCHRCGFTTRTIHWQCSGCRSWGTLLPTDTQ
ncbi:MAG: lipopolysaccharide assembly protein LapB [Pseudomonadota bacterium]